MKLTQFGSILGKVAEYAMCKTINTPYYGKYTHSIQPVHELTDRFSQNPLLYDNFKDCLHSGDHCPVTGVHHPPYDFINPNNMSNGLNVKTVLNNKYYKVSPNTIGQPSKKRFCQFFQFPLMEPEVMKPFMMNQMPFLMEQYDYYMFQYPILLYHAQEDKCLLIYKNPEISIPWNDLKFLYSHEHRGKEWNESTSLKVQSKELITSKSLGEFQFHNHRDCIKFRFNLKNVLELFPESFEVNEW